MDFIIDEIRRQREGLDRLRAQQESAVNVLREAQLELARIKDVDIESALTALRQERGE